MQNPWKELSVKEWWLWSISMLIVTVSNLVGGSFDVLTLAATWVGITSLIFAAKGNVWAQFLMIAFSILYGIISFRFRYWGEMITYLGMTLPMAVWSAVTWLRNPSAGSKSEVAIRRLEKKHFLFLLVLSIVVTGAFYFILRWLETPNIVFSTLSVTTSFLAASLTMLRSSYYALGYAANDLVLIVLWGLAAAKDPVYIPVIINFMIFFMNDMYGFISWKKRERTQLCA
ncbi:nicotinamide riboside transporter PnuC [uncultured Ruminococcus sp.]|uniref:nicotinamide riboside transporter PnuC n=1 Tax=uncultured Ruminococcus sp. TaxID=165186 RepID=UPI0025D9DBDB|nr:nicotinamide riboside transporter PnuC [uncultured Ruminococcus sp.]